MCNLNLLRISGTSFSPVPLEATDTEMKFQIYFKRNIFAFKQAPFEFDSYISGIRFSFPPPSDEFSRLIRREKVIRHY